jgi:hypothetical protein
MWSRCGLGISPALTTRAVGLRLPAVTAVASTLERPRGRARARGPAQLQLWRNINGLSPEAIEQWLLSSRFAVRRDDGSLEITPLGFEAAQGLL